MPYLSLAIWVPIVAGLAVLAVGRDARRRHRALDRARSARRSGFVVTLPLWLHFDAGHLGHAVRRAHRVDSALRHPLLPRRRRHLDAVRAAEQPDDARRRLVGLGGDRDARRAVHGGVPDPVRASSTARSRALDGILFYIVLRGDADPDVPHHRRLGRPEPRVRGGQVLPLHAAGLAADAGGAHLPLQRLGHVLDPRVVPRPAVARRADAAVRRLLPVVLGQGADVAGAHVAARRARRGADRRLGDPRGDHAQDRRVRLRPLHPADRAGCVALPVRRS